MNHLRENLQDEFLNHLCERKGASTVFLINGVKLQGIITAFSDTSVLLRREAHEQLIYKHAISTIMPHTKIGLFDIGDEAEEQSEDDDL